MTLPNNMPVRDVMLAADQSGHLELDEFRRAPNLLPAEQRESLILVGASNESAPTETAIDLAGVLLRRRNFYLHRSRKATIFIYDEFE